MMRTCQKCGHMNAAATGDELEACPACGAIYSRVAAAMAARAADAPPAAFDDSRMPARPAGSGPALDKGGVHGFAYRMREASLYPTFRDLVRLIYLAWMLLAVLALLGALAAAAWSTGVARVGGFLVGLFFALFFMVIAKVTREGALMLADLSDAAVQIAARMKA